MPIYEYKCQKCNTLFEVLVNSFTNDCRPCPSCGSNETNKQMSAAGVVTKSAGMPSHCPSAPSCAAAGASCCGGGACRVNN